jgi:uncharacterized damage-inducible protein DinB
MFAYNDDANDLIFTAATTVNESKLDTPFDMGRCSLRKTLIHILAGEDVWLKRWQGHVETPWHDEDKPLTVEAIHKGIKTVSVERDAFLKKVGSAELAAYRTYRDSKGSRFQASLSDMIFQAFTHSTHHRAQAVNMLRRLEIGLVEVDCMTLRRKPA